MDKIEGYLEVGFNERCEVVVNLDKDRTGHVIFSPNQARHLAGILIAKSKQAEDHRAPEPQSQSDNGAVDVMVEGFEILCRQARLIAMLPLEEWRTALDKAETIGPILDPTLYREYLRSDKPQVIKKIINAAIELKKIVLEVQPIVAKSICDA